MIRSLLAVAGGVTLALLTPQEWVLPGLLGLCVGMVAGAAWAASAAMDDEDDEDEREAA